MNRWRDAHATSGWSSGVVLAVTVIAGLAWIGWPVWSSLTAPDLTTLRTVTPSLLVAQCGLLLLLAWAIWRDSGHRTSVFAPITLVVVAATLLRGVLQPSSAGIEPVLALPLLAGAVLGAPAGFLTGAGAAMASSVVLGLVDAPLVGQVIVWGLWGAWGGLFHRARPVAAWLGCLVSALPLALVSGLLLNAIGWTGELDSSLGSFLPGLGAWESYLRLCSYTLATSWAVDAMRGATTTLLIVVVGHPLISALRAAAGTEAPSAPLSPLHRTPEITDQAIQHRRRSHSLSVLWPRTEGPHDDPPQP